MECPAGAVASAEEGVSVLYVQIVTPAKH